MGGSANEVNTVSPPVLHEGNKTKTLILRAVGAVALLVLLEGEGFVRDKKLSPVEYATALLARIERHDPNLNAFIAGTIACWYAREPEAELMEPWGPDDSTSG